jgi:hypothetical protein
MSPATWAEQLTLQPRKRRFQETEQPEVLSTPSLLQFPQAWLQKWSACKPYQSALEDHADWDAIVASLVQISQSLQAAEGRKSHEPVTQPWPGREAVFTRKTCVTTTMPTEESRTSR